MNGDDLWFQVRRMINEYEQARDPDASEIGRQFAQLQRTMIENKDIYPSVEGAKAINRLKNRYKDVLPYDQHRVILQSDRNSDYINASFVEDFHGKRRYIAAQGPIEDSVEDFFQMIWENQITSIICAANDTEAGRFKFLRYWPDAEHTLDFNSYRITLDKTDDRAYQCEYYVIRPLIVSQGNNQRHVLLYHLLQWFDHDVPSSEEPIYELLIRLDKDRTASPDTPILIHCSAGCGRTGSIIAIDLGRLFLQDKHLQSLEQYRLQPVFAIATHIRQFRIALIQTTKQYLFVHKMFSYMLQITGHVSRSSSSSYPIEENASSPPSTATIYSSSPSKSSRRSSGPFLNLRNPPIGRRSNRNGTSKTSPAVLQTSDSVVMPAKAEDSLDTYDPIPPPIPPRTLIDSSALDARINRRVVPRFSRAQHRQGQILDSTALSNPIKPNRSDSADALSSPSSSSNSSKFNERPINHRAGMIFDHGAISD